MRKYRRPRKGGGWFCYCYCCCWMVSLSYTRPRPPVVRNNRESWLFLETAWLKTDCVYQPGRKIEWGRGQRKKEMDRLLGVVTTRGDSGLERVE